MDDRILLNPGNRLLGTSTGDFGLYGGQSDPSIAVHAVHGSDTGELARISDLSAPEAGTAAMLISSGAPPHAQPIFVPQENGGAASITLASLGLLSSAQPFHIAAVEDISPMPDWSALAPGAGAPRPVFDSAGNLDDSIGADAGAASALTSPVPGVADGALAATIGSIDEALANAGTLLDGAQETVQGAVTTTLDLVDAKLTGALGAVDDVASVLGGTGHVVSATVGTVDDTLSGLAGSNPLGGVATLVSLVSVTDLFDLHPVDAPVPDTTGDLGFGTLDALVGDTPLPDALLGTGDHHEGGALGIDHLLDHPLGL